MKICAAQTKPVTGNIQRNIENHVALINSAVSHCADLIIFPELSLTGYEPALAKSLAINPGDARLEVFQKIADSKKIVIGVGAPTKNGGGICISLILFQPQTARRIYSKTYLHADEVPFFVAGSSAPDLKVNGHNLALAICYEISVPQHLEAALKSKPQIFLASVAKFARGFDKALATLSETARQNSMTALMSNSIGPADNGECCGKTSVWNSNGESLAHLDNSHEGILIFDTETQEVITLQ